MKYYPTVVMGRTWMPRNREYILTSEECDAIRRLITTRKITMRTCAQKTKIQAARLSQILGGKEPIQGKQAQSIYDFLQGDGSVNFLEHYAREDRIPRHRTASGTEKIEEHLMAVANAYLGRLRELYVQSPVAGRFDILGELERLVKKYAPLDNTK